jgi:lysophospholipase L1-like esterase
LNTYKENFNAKKQIFILLGDSIFNNNSYVSDGKNIEYLLLERTNGNVISLAVDDAKIIHVYNQILKIPNYLDSKNTTIFLSIGGNDIISQLENNSSNSNILNTIFSAYKKLIKNIQSKIPKANLVLCDIYYPTNLKYKQFHPYIQQWNNMIYNYAKESKNNIYSVFKISRILTQPEDFTLDIEPSNIGSQKIVDSIMSSY